MGLWNLGWEVEEPICIKLNSFNWVQIACMVLAISVECMVVDVGKESSFCSLQAMYLANKPQK